MHRHLSLLLILLLPGLLLAQAKTKTNSVGMEFVLVPAGSFTMGTFEPTCAPAGTQDNVTEEQYQECVKLANAATRTGFKADVPKPFYIGKYEVTQEQYQKVMGKNPSYHTRAIVGEPSDKYPVDSVSWQDAQAFVKKLNSMEKTKAYRSADRARVGVRRVRGDGQRRAGRQDSGHRLVHEQCRSTSLTPWGPWPRMPGVSTTCWATSGSGCRTGTTTTPYRKHRRALPKAPSTF